MLFIILAFTNNQTVTAMVKSFVLKSCCILIFSFFSNTQLAFENKDDQSKPLNIVFIGDSITEGAATENGPANYAVDYLKKQKGSGAITFSNQGHSGYTTVDFLPSTGDTFTEIEKAADSLQKLNNGNLLFSIMLGTNDSAEEGPNGSPVSPENYQRNLKIIIDSLLSAYPGAKAIIHLATWYSPTTYNSSRYLESGLKRLQSYFPEIDKLIAGYQTTHPGQVFKGDEKAFNFFKKNYVTHFNTEHGQRGVFYLHPNSKGAKSLGVFWGKAIKELRF